MKRLLASISIAVVSCGLSVAATFGPQGVASTPDSEFVTLSDMASMPIAATAGDALPPSESVGTPQEIPAAAFPATPVIDEPVTNVEVMVVTNVVVEAVKPEGATGAETNVIAAADTSTELMPVLSFMGASEKQNLISIALDDVPLQDVVRLFTRISGANIISSSTNLQGKVTVNLQDVEWKPALDSILDMYSLMVSEKVPGSGIYSVVTKVPGTEPLIAQPIFLNYAQVSNVVAVVLPMVGKGGTVSPFPNANALVVRANAADLSSIIKVVEGIDVPRQQVYIEAKILELTDEAIKDLGVNWQVLEGYGIGVGTLSQTINDERSTFNGNRQGLGTVDSNLRAKSSDGGEGLPGTGQTDVRTSTDTLSGKNNSSISDTTEDGLSSSLSTSSGRDTSDTITKSANYSRESEHIKGQHLSDIRTAVLSADDFRVVLSALQQINGITIISNPKIIVANEETAMIHIGENQPNIRGTVTAGQQGQANTTTYALDTLKPYFEFGVSLEVTPTINNQSNISVRILPTLSRYVKDLDAPDGTKYPIEATKKIKTVFSLESGKTAAIGGLTETSERENVKKIPLLGDIPLIGKYLFSYTHKEHLQTETIIFVTVGLANPRAVHAEEGLPEETALAQNQMIVMKKKRDQRKADALKIAIKDKADSANAESAKEEGATVEKTP